jgi:HEAT repeat protein
VATPVPTVDPHLHVLPLPPPDPHALPDNPPELEALYFVEGTPPARRIEIVRALGHVDSTESAAVLGRIFEHDKRMETRMEVVQAASDFASPATHAGKLAILTRAVAPTQPQIMRLNALQALADFDDPSVPALLKTLSTDSSSAIREAADGALKARAQ